MYTINFKSITKNTPRDTVKKNWNEIKICSINSKVDRKIEQRTYRTNRNNLQVVSLNSTISVITFNGNVKLTISIITLNVTS